MKILKIKIKLIWIKIFNKIKLKARRQKLIKKDEGTKNARIIIGQAFFISCTDGPIIAPTLSSRRIIIQLCHLNKLSWVMSVKGSRRVSFQLFVKDLIVKMSARINLFTRNKNSSPPKIGAEEMRKFPTKGILDFVWVTCGWWDITLNSVIFAPVRIHNIAWELSWTNAPI